MRVLVTGARGYLGRPVVEALRRRGHAVRALDVSDPAAVPTPDGVEPLRGDVCSAGVLAGACAGVDAVIHLAAKLTGEAQAVVASAVDGTRGLVEAMGRAGVRRLVLASSLSVYDWGAADDALTEDSRLERAPERRDAYTTAKLLQERLARDECARLGIALTVLRPAMIWGRGREVPPTIGQRAGPLHLVFGARRQLPTVHVENCADAFAAALDAPAAAGETFNVVDHEEVTAAAFVADHLRRSGRRGLALPVAYRVALAAVSAVHRLSPPWVRARLPDFVAPARFEARYRPLRVTGDRLRTTAGWYPPLSYAECLDRTYGAPPARAAGPGVTAAGPGAPAPGGRR